MTDQETIQRIGNIVYGSEGLGKHIPEKLIMKISQLKTDATSYRLQNKESCRQWPYQQEADANTYPYCSSACKQELNPGSEFAVRVNSILSEIGEMLVQKNKAYGDSALNPSRIFAKGNPDDLIKVRIDDKLTRIKNIGIGGDSEDSVNDLIGYLILLKISQQNKASQLTEQQP